MEQPAWRQNTRRFGAALVGVLVFLFYVVVLGIAAAPESHAVGRAARAAGAPLWWDEAGYAILPGLLLGGAMGYAVRLAMLDRLPKAVAKLGRKGALALALLLSPLAYASVKLGPTPGVMMFEDRVIRFDARTEAVKDVHFWQDATSIYATCYMAKRNTRPRFHYVVSFADGFEANLHGGWDSDRPGTWLTVVAALDRKLRARGVPKEADAQPDLDCLSRYDRELAPSRRLELQRLMTES